MTITTTRYWSVCCTVLLASACEGSIPTPGVRRSNLVEVVEPAVTSGDCPGDGVAVPYEQHPIDPSQIDLDDDGVTADVDPDDDRFEALALESARIDSASAERELLRDADGDGVSAPRDCDDDTPELHPGATDWPCNGIDEDCTGHDDCDTDGDGADDHDDLDPNDPAVGRPPSPEIYRRAD